MKKYLLVVLLAVIGFAQNSSLHCLEDAIQINTLQQEISKKAFLDLHLGDWAQYRFKPAISGIGQAKLIYVGQKEEGGVHYYGVEYVSGATVVQVWYVMQRVVNRIDAEHTFQFIVLDPRFGYTYMNGRVWKINKYGLVPFTSHWLQFISWGARFFTLDCPKEVLRIEKLTRTVAGHRLHITKITDITTQATIEESPVVPFGMVRMEYGKLGGAMELIAFGRGEKVRITSTMREHAQSIPMPMMPMGGMQ